MAQKLHRTPEGRLTLSIHGFCIHTGVQGPRPSHRFTPSEPVPGSQTQKRKAGPKPKPNAPGSSKATKKTKRAERRRLLKEGAGPKYTAPTYKHIDWSSII